nr:hypothetical protein [Tanacetum cinerariifolium]
ACKKFELNPKRLEEDYHTIKDDTMLVNVYTTGEVIVREMLILNDLLTNTIRDTQVYKDYVAIYGGVEVLMIQPEPVESTQGTHKTPTTTTTPNLVDVEKTGSYKNDAFRKRDHDEHQGDDAPPEGEKTGSYKNDAFRKHDHDEHQGDDALLEGEKKEPNEPPRYLYNKDLFFLKKENTKEKRYMLSLYKIHSISFPEEDLEKKMNRWVKSVLRRSVKKQSFRFNTGKIHGIRECTRYITGKREFTTFNWNRELPDQDKPHYSNITFPNIKACDPFSIIDKLTTGLIYFNNKNEKRFIDLKEPLKFYDAILKKVLKKVKMKIFETKFMKKAPLLGSLDLKITKVYEREILKRLKHRKQMKIIMSHTQSSSQPQEQLLTTDQLVLADHRWPTSPLIYMQQMWSTILLNDSKETLSFKIDQHDVDFSLADLRTMLHLPQETDNNHESYMLLSATTTTISLRIPKALLTKEIMQTDAYNQYNDNFKKIVVSMMQPQPVVSTQGMHMILSAPRKEHQKVRSDPSEVYSNQKIVEVNRVKNQQGYGKDFMEEFVVKHTDGIKSYLIKINLIAPTLFIPGIQKLEPYTIITDPYIGIMYENSKKESKVMNINELPNFYDATLKRVLRKVEEIKVEAHYGFKDPPLSKEDKQVMELFK